MQLFTVLMLSSLLSQVPSPMSELPNSGVLPQQHQQQQQQQQQQQHQLQQQQQQSLPLQPPPAHLASSSPVTAGSSLPSPATPLAATSAAPSNAQATPTPPPQQVWIIPSGKVCYEYVFQVAPDLEFHFLTLK